MAVIAGLLTGFAASPWMRAALRYGAIAVAIVLLLLSIRRSGGRVGRIAENKEVMPEQRSSSQRELRTSSLF